MLKGMKLFIAVLLGAIAALLLAGVLPSWNPFTRLFGEGQTKVTSGLPKVSLEKLSELVTLKVNTERVIDGYNSYYKALVTCGGDALIGTDLKRATIAADPTTKKMTITLPEPKLVIARVDMRRTKVYDISKQSAFNVGEWFIGDKQKLIQEILVKAQGVIEEESMTEEYVKQSKVQAELIVKTLYTELGWEVEIIWEGSPPVSK